MSGPLLALGVVAVVLAFDVWLGSRIGRFMSRQDRIERAHTTRAHFLGGRR